MSWQSAAVSSASSELPPVIEGPMVWLNPLTNRDVNGFHAGGLMFSADGNSVMFVTLSPGREAMAYDRRTNELTRVTMQRNGVTEPVPGLSAVSGDGSVVVFVSQNLLPGDPVDREEVYAIDRRTGAVQRVGTDPTGHPADLARDAAISADGTLVAFMGDFTSAPTQLDGRQIYVRDLTNGHLELMSVGAGDRPTGGGRADCAAISDDGRYVTFWSQGPYLLDPNGHEPPYPDFYIRDRTSGVTSRGVPVPGVPRRAVLSGDGTTVAYLYDDATGGAPNFSGRPNLHIYKRASGRDRIVDLSTLSSFGLYPVGDPTAVSADGRYIVLQAGRQQPTGGNPSATLVYDDVLNRLAPVSVTSAGLIVGGSAAEPNGCFTSPRAIAGDGTAVAFSSSDDGLVSADANHQSDGFVRAVDFPDVGMRPVPIGTTILEPIQGMNLEPAVRMTAHSP